MLHREELMSVLNTGNHPEAAVALHKAKQWILMKWGLLSWARWVLAELAQGNSKPPLTWNSVVTDTLGGVAVALPSPGTPKANGATETSSAGFDSTELVRAIHGIR